MRIDRIEVGDGPVTTIEFDKVTTTEVDALRFKTKDLVLTGGIIANGSIGTDGQVLVSNELGELYWSDPSTQVSQRFIADGITNTFTITDGYVPSSLLVFLNGVKQNPDIDVDVSSGTDIVFATTPSAGFNIDVIGQQASAITGVVSITTGDGLSGGYISSLGTISVDAKDGLVANSSGLFILANEGLNVNSSGLSVLANSGLTVNSSGLFILANSGITANSSGLFGSASLANSGLIANSSGLSVLANSGIVANATGTYVLANSGIVANTTGTYVLANSGLTVNSTGIFVLANTGIISNTSGVFSNTTFLGNSSTIAATFLNIAENINVSSTAATGTINYYLASQSVLYYTASAAANWTPNVAYSATTPLNTAMATGQAITLSFLVTQGSPAYFANTINIDGSAVTPKWTSGTIPTAGNINSIDAYTYTIIKTGSAAFTVLANVTQYK